jgi:hypothetical protein
MFCAPEPFLGGSAGARLIFIFCSPEPVLGGTEGVRSRFNVLRSRTHFRWYRGRRVPLSCLALPDSFSAVPRAPSLFFIFYAPGPVLGSIDGIWSCFMFAHPDSFWAVSRVRGPILLFCAPRLLLGVTEGVGSYFHVLHSRTHFRRY